MYQSNVEILSECFKITKDEKHTLGNGSFGTVYLGELCDGGQKVAAKQIVVYNHTKFLNLSKENEMDACTHILRIVPHRNLIKIHASLRKYLDDILPGDIVLWHVTEYCPLGNLTQYIFRSKLCSEQKLNLIYQWSLALRHLHEFKRSTNNVKPENILLTGHPYSPDVKLTDFGNLRPVIVYNASSKIMQSKVGTNPWKAPEQLPTQNTFSFNKSVDTYSSAMIALALLDSSQYNLLTPFQITPSYKKEANGQCPFIHNATDTGVVLAIKHILTEMLSFHPTNRPSMAQVVKELSKIYAASPGPPPPYVEPIVRPKTQAAKIASTPQHKLAKKRRVTVFSEDQIVPDVNAYDTERVLVAGGFTAGYKVNENCVFFDEHDSVLTQIPLRARANRSIIHHVSVCAAPDGFIASGGWYSSSSSSLPSSSSNYRTISRMQRFNIQDRAWTDLPNMPRTSRMHGSICSNNRFFAVGGELFEKGKSKTCYAAVSVLDLITFKWSELKPLPTAVYGPGVAVVKSGVLVVGGRDFVYGTTAEAYKYDKLTGERTICKPMPKPCTPYNCTVTSGTDVFVLDTQCNVFMQYNTLTDEWSKLKCPLKHFVLGALVRHGNDIFLLGGFEDFYLDVNASVQRYNSTKNTWVLDPQTMPIPLGYHAAFAVKMPYLE